MNGPREHAVACVRCQYLTWRADAVCLDCIRGRVLQDVKQLADVGVVALPHRDRTDALTGRVVVDPAEVLAVLGGAS